MIIALALFVGSVLGMVVMVVRRLPETYGLPQEAGGAAGISLYRAWRAVGESKLWNVGIMLALEKSLRMLRLWALKTDRRMSGWLERLRQRKQNGSATTLAEPMASDKIQEPLQEEPSSRSLYLPLAAREQERTLIKKIAENPQAVTAYKELGFLYLRYNQDDYAQQALRMATRLGSQDRRILSILRRLERGERHN